MREEAVLAFLPLRLKQLGYERSHVRYRNISVSGGEALILQAYNSLFFLIGNPAELKVESCYGLYDGTGESQGENFYQHRGEIVITNLSPSAQRIQFIQAILI